MSRRAGWSVVLSLLLLSAAGHYLAPGANLTPADPRMMDGHLMWLLLPWILVGVAGAVLFGVLRYGLTRGPVQFVVLRGRINCPECSYLIDLDDRHCARCGVPVSEVKRRVPCSACRCRNWEDDQFCRQCGKALTPPPAEPDTPGVRADNP